MRRMMPPSAAMVVALVALFVALSGTALAIGEKIVSLAKRALTAKKANMRVVRALALLLAVIALPLSAGSARAQSNILIPYLDTGWKYQVVPRWPTGIRSTGIRRLVFLCGRRRVWYPVFRL
jgi:hypothetical protein